MCETRPIAKRKEEKLLTSKRMSVLVQDLEQVFPIVDQWKFTGWEVKGNEYWHQSPFPTSLPQHLDFTLPAQSPAFPPASWPMNDMEGTQQWLESGPATLHFSSQSTQPQHMSSLLMGCLDWGSIHLTRLTPPHTHQHPSSFPRLWEFQWFWSFSSFLLETDWGTDLKKPHLLNHTECYVLMKHDGFCNHQGISHKHPFPLMQSSAVTLNGSEKQYKT